MSKNNVVKMNVANDLGYGSVKARLMILKSISLQC